MNRQALRFLLAVVSCVLWVSPGQGASRGQGAIASAHPLATAAGAQMLAKGGNAVDAAVAVSFALSVVEPWSSGIGGGGFMVVRMNGRTQTWDFRETAPAAATATMFQRKGKVVRGLSTTSWLACGIPGQVRGLVKVHTRYGRLKLTEVLEPAIKYARSGFKVSARFHGAISGARANMNDAARKIFLTSNGEAPPIGSMLRQTDLADTLSRIARTKGEDFYTGVTAKRLVTAVRKHGGIWTATDLKGYQVKTRPPVVGRYRGYTIHSMGPPSSGGLLLVQMLAVLERVKLYRMPWTSARYVHTLAEAMKRAFAMRAKGLGDPDHARVSRPRFIGKRTIRRLVAQVRRAAKATPAARIGEVRVKPRERTDTSHFGVLMANGDAVACTQTINLRFGNGKVAKGTGVVLNDEMDDFSAKPGAPNAFGLVGDIANAIAPHKRPLSSMTPTLVLRGPRAVGVFGSPGGSRIISTTLQSILNVIDGRMSVTKAIGSPRLHHQWYPDVVFFEAKRLSPGVERRMKRLGHKVAPSGPMGNAMGLWRARSGRLSGAADPRGEGSAIVR